LFSLSLSYQGTFDQLDKDQNGSVDCSELGIALELLDYKLSEAQIHALLQKVDKNQDGQISFEEFSRFFEFVPAVNLRSVAQQWMNEVSH